jgi:hypothetical protein
MALVKVIEHMKHNARDDAERFTENGKASSRRRANHGFRARSPKALGMILSLVKCCELRKVRMHGARTRI